MAANHPNRNKKKTKTAAVAPAARGRRTTPAAQVEHDHDIAYAAVLDSFRAGFNTAVAGQSRIFTTDAEGLWEAYLGAFPTAKERQHHDCNCCRRFIQTYGGLVTISEQGLSRSVIWAAAAPEPYSRAFVDLAVIVKAAKVTGVFISSKAVWGTPENTSEAGDVWTHLSVVPPAPLVYGADGRPTALDPNQAAAVVRHNVETVTTALREYGPNVLDEAVRLFSAEVLARSEKFLAPVRWLRALHDRPKGDRGQNLLWRAVAMAPDGFCHVKSTVIGPLLDDIAAGTSFDVIKRKHAAMLDPIKYQRSQAAPAAGNIAAAEKLVERLGIEPALHRRFARIEELPLDAAIWLPPERSTPRAGAGRGVFGHIKPKQGFAAAPPSVDLPEITMTWEKFGRQVLDSNPERIEFLVPNSGSFVGMLTAVNPEAPPILKWDDVDERNTFSTYTYVRPMSASSWSLEGGRFAKVNAIVALPNLWGSNPRPHLGIGAFLIVDGCRDTNRGGGNALFPETLKDDLHGIRATVEAFAKSAEMHGRDAASACGWTIRNGNANIVLRVFAGSAWTRYRIDRWD